MSEIERKLQIGKRVIFACVDKTNGIGVHYWIEPDWEQQLATISGVEIHIAADTDFDNDHCWLLDGPCNHDGSSLYAKEVFDPRFFSGCEQMSYERIWVMLESRIAHEVLDRQHAQEEQA